MEELHELKRPTLIFLATLTGPAIAMFTPLRAFVYAAAWPMAVFTLIPGAIFMLMWTGIVQLSGRTKKHNEFLDILAGSTGLFCGATSAIYLWPGAS